MKGIIYTRVSSDEQVKGTSLEFQEDLCRKYCEQRDIEVVEIFREEGESAKDLSLNNRKKFLAALEFCRKRKHQIDAFIVLRVDRFARNTEDHFAVRKILLEYGTTLHSVTEPIGNKPAEKFIETVLAGAAEYDNAIRKQRCSDGMSQKINQGLYPWKTPLGYVCNNSKKRGEKKTQPDPPDEKIFPIVQRGLKHYAQGLCTQVELMRLLDTWGLATARGRATTIQLVDRILGKYLKFYAGILENPFTGEDKDGLHIPMITKEEYFRIMFVKSGKIKRAVKHDRYNPLFPLRRTVLCFSCNRNLTGSTPRGRNGHHSYYHCHNKQCPMYGKGIPKQDLEREFREFLRTIIPKESWISAFRAIVLDAWKDKGKLCAEQVQQYEKQIAKLEVDKKKAGKMREEESYTKEEFLERKAEIENEITAIQISLNETKLDELDIEAAYDYAASFIRDLERQWFDIPASLRPRFQKLILPDGISYERGKGFGTARLGYIFEVNRRFGEVESPVVDPGRIELPPQQCECRVIPLYYGPFREQG
jgi:site-specific DNA recombinase